MDAQRFDALIRSLAVPSRRRLLAALGSAIFAALAGHTDDEATARGRRRRDANERLEAARHKHRKKHGRHKHKKKGKKKHPSPRIQPTAGCVQRCASTRPCGDDGCGGACGICASNERCQNGTCVCVPSCGVKTCGPDGCGGKCGPDCTGNDECVNGNCTCVSQCNVRECGFDTCGIDCGTCSQPECSIGSCTAGRCEHAPDPGCCDDDAQCETNNRCTVDSCGKDLSTCRHDPVPSDSRTECPLNNGNAGFCDGSGQCVQCLINTDCDEISECTSSICDNGTCQHPPAAVGIACTRSGGETGVCDGAGACVQCASAADCDTGDPCVIPRCEPNGHTCAYAYQQNYTSCGGTSYCENGVCHPCEPAGKVCLDSRQCCANYSGYGGFCSILFSPPRCCKGPKEPCQVNSECCYPECIGKTSPSGQGFCAGTFH